MSGVRPGVGARGAEVISGAAMTFLPAVGAPPARQRHLPPVPGWKRPLDIVLSGLALLALAPLILAIAALVRLTSPGPAFFVQERVGFGGRRFGMIKFRSMYADAEARRAALLAQSDRAGLCFKMKDDPRVTPLGRVLRRTSLDELPQLFNVLRGEMSIVGPRPERPYFVEQFSSEIEGYGDRHRVPVGITGWAQVNGYWGDTSIEARVRLDNRYIENWSLWRDLVIAVRTIPTLLGGRR